jgi:RNA-binding motif X-linked protein 2
MVQESQWAQRCDVRQHKRVFGGDGGGSTFTVFTELPAGVLYATRVPHFRDSFNFIWRPHLRNHTSLSPNIATMNTVRSIQRLNERELADGTPPTSSWHTDYRDTAFIYIGGLPFELSEGDVITIFSQYGEPVWVKMARDKETGKSRGFCWLKYEDQRSCDLAVDNLSGAKVMDRTLAVDHTRYKPRDDEDMRDNTMGELDLGEEDDEVDGGRKKRRRTESESESDEDRPMIKEEIELEKLLEMDDDDPMKASMVQKKQEQVDAALKKLKSRKKKEKKHRSRRHHGDRDGSKEREREHRRIKNTEGPLDSEKPRRRRSRSRDARDGHRSSRRDLSREDDRSRIKRKDSEDEARDPKPARRRSRSRSKERSLRPAHSEEPKDKPRRRSRDRRRHSSDEDDDRYSKSKRPSRRDDRGVRRSDQD